MKAEVRTVFLFGQVLSRLHSTSEPEPWGWEVTWSPSLPSERNMQKRERYKRGP